MLKGFLCINNNNKIIAPLGLIGVLESNKGILQGQKDRIIIACKRFILLSNQAQNFH